MKLYKVILLITLIWAPALFANGTCANFFGLEYIARQDNHASLSLAEKKKLIATTLNLNNFFVTYPDAKRFPQIEQTAPYKIPSKSYKEVQAYRKVLDEIDSDLYVFQEVIGEYSSRALDPRGEYLHINSETSDITGSHTVFMVRKTLNAQARVIYPQSTDNRVMPRGMPVLIIKAKDTNGKVIEPERPDLMVMGVHLKSQRGLEENVYNKIKAREIEALQRAHGELKKRFKEAPLMIAGDFNVDLMRNPHAIHLRKSLADSIDLTHPELGEKDRVTQVYIDEATGTYTANQIDGVFVTPSLADKLVDSFVHHYRDSAGKIKKYQDGRGNVLPFPTNRAYRDQEISDHNPIVTVIAY